MERQNTVSIGDIKNFAFLKSGGNPKDQSTTLPGFVDGKYDWYQNNTHVFLTFKVMNDKELAK